jgi:hypothetical protein
VSVLLGQGDGSFLPAVSYQVGTGPGAVVVGDFDHDGKLDLATANSGDNTITVLLGNGNGTFQDSPGSLAQNTYFVGSSPSALVADDFLHNGNLDLVAANFGDNTVTVLLGNGDGTFQDDPRSLAQHTFSVGNGPNTVAVGDFNNDGAHDLVTANAYDNTVSELLGLGEAQFRTATPANSIAPRNTPFLQDLTGDGIADQLVLNSSGDLLFRQGLPGPANSFAPPVPINAGRPARDATVYRTGSGWAVAAIDQEENTVSLYIWDPATKSFRHTVAFATGNFPSRIAAADLTGKHLDDLVVANAFDNALTIAFQAPLNQMGPFVPFGTTQTVPVGAAPSDISFASGGSAGPDIVVSDQASGDFSILFNDASHSFGRQSRYRAGNSPFDIDNSTGQQTVASQLQTAAIVAADFIGPGRKDLVVVNRGSHSFTLLPDQGQRTFTNPLPENTYTTSAQPGQAVSFQLPGDKLPSLAILMEDLGQIWIYRNNGDGTFATPSQANGAVIAVGDSASGLSVTQIKGQVALLVGNKFGDVLTLLYEKDKGRLGPDRAGLQQAPLAVGTDARTGQQFAIVANQDRDQVMLYHRIPGTDQLSAPVAITGSNQWPILAPGAVQMFSVPGDPLPYLAVANSLSNNVLIYHYSTVSAGFDLLSSDSVGDSPVSITVADLNKDGVPDLLVANRGSNDVSVLMGAIDPNTNLWTETLFQRLNSGGSGPIAVAVRDSGSPNGPDLLVTNSDGKVFLLPGIGSAGKGSGFFQDTNPQQFDLGAPIVQALFNAATEQLFEVSDTGSVSILTGSGFQSLVSQGVATLGAVGPFLVAGFEDGSVGLLSSNGTTLARLPSGFKDQPSALEALQNGQGVDVYVSEAGTATATIVSFAFIPIVTEPPASVAVAQGTSLPGSNYLLVAILLSSGPVEQRPGPITESAPGAEVFALFLPPSPRPTGLTSTGNGADSGEPEEAEVVTVAGSDVPAWQRFPLGVSEALRRDLQGRQFYDRLENVLDGFKEVLDRFKELVQPPPAPPVPEQPAVPVPPTADAPASRTEKPAQAEARSGDHAPTGGVPAPTATAVDWFARMEVLLPATPSPGLTEDGEG